jgi:hypothetical protein
MAFAYSLATMFSYVAANKIRTLPEANIDMSLQIVESSNWIENREQIVEHALGTDRTHIMWLDDDMSFQPQILEILLGRRQRCVLSNYLIKTDDWQEKPQYVAVDLDGKRVPVDKTFTGIQPISYSGFGCSVMEVSIFKEVLFPRFLPKPNMEMKKYTTEDNPFFEKVREAGIPVYLDHDASKLLTHIGQAAWNWQGVRHG